MRLIRKRGITGRNVIKHGVAVFVGQGRGEHLRHAMQGDDAFVAIHAGDYAAASAARHNARMAEPALNLSPSPGDEVKSTTCVCALARGAKRREGRRT